LTLRISYMKLMSRWRLLRALTFTRSQQTELSYKKRGVVASGLRALYASA
jgi:hypothetical protein